MKESPVSKLLEMCASSNEEPAVVLERVKCRLRKLEHATEVAEVVIRTQEAVRKLRNADVKAYTILGVMMTKTGCSVEVSQSALNHMLDTK